MSTPCQPRRGQPTRRRGARPGFSLLEITLVLVIIGMLMAVAAVNLLGGAERARKKTTKISMKTIQTSIKDYQLNHAGTPPTSLSVLVNDDYLEDTALKDGWDQQFYYTVSATNQERQYQLISNGPDKTPGTEDDISVWTMDAEGQN